MKGYLDLGVEDVVVGLDGAAPVDGESSGFGGMLTKQLEGLQGLQTDAAAQSQALATAQGDGFRTALAGAVGSVPGQRASQQPGGVQVAGIAEDDAPARRVYDPGHPDADGQGYVSLPNVNPVTEMVDLISASRAYEANVTAMQTAKTMFSKTFELLR